jgi:hypothetical protein
MPSGPDGECFPAFRHVNESPVARATATQRKVESLAHRPMDRVRVGSRLRSFEWLTSRSCQRSAGIKRRAGPAC